MSNAKRRFNWDEDDREDYQESRTNRKPEKFKPQRDERWPIDREDFYRQERYQEDDR